MDKYTPTENNIYFLCYLVELMCRDSKNNRKYVVNKMDREYILRICKYEHVFHSMNFEELVYNERKILDIITGTVYREETCMKRIPTVKSFARLYTSLIYKFEGDVIDNFYKVMLSPISEIIDNFNGTFYYENPDYIAACIEEGIIIPD